MKTNRRFVILPLLIFLAFCFNANVEVQSQERNIFKERRAELASLIEKGIAIIQSSEKNQDNLLEFFVPNSDNHDFI